MADRQLLVEATEKMLRLGIPAHLSGYNYIRSSIIKCIEDPEVATSVTKLLYPDIAKEFKTNCSNVERAIRHAIEVGWARGNSSIQEELFGYSNLDNGDRPTNSEFVAVVADYIRMQTIMKKK